MSNHARIALAVSAILAFDGLAPARAADIPQVQEAAILQILVLEGDSAVHALGSRSVRPLSVRVADETGRPVSGAAVSFRLPEEGPGGVFASGMKSEVSVTGSDGRASVWGILWNRAAGPFQVRVTAVKGQSRAGIVISQYLSENVSENPSDRPPLAASGRARGRLFYLLLASVAGAAAGGAAMGLNRNSRQTPPQAASAALTAPTQIGAPVISIGTPP